MNRAVCVFVCNNAAEESINPAHPLMSLPVKQALRDHLLHLLKRSLLVSPSCPPTRGPPHLRRALNPPLGSSFQWRRELWEWTCCCRAEARLAEEARAEMGHVTGKMWERGGGRLDQRVHLCRPPPRTHPSQAGHMAGGHGSDKVPPDSSQT